MKYNISTVLYTRAVTHLSVRQAQHHMYMDVRELACTYIGMWVIKASSD